jgi:hypothetical protein
MYRVCQTTADNLGLQPGAGPIDHFATGNTPHVLPSALNIDAPTTPLEPPTLPIRIAPINHSIGILQMPACIWFKSALT